MGEDDVQGASWHALESVPAFCVFPVAWHRSGSVPPTHIVGVDSPELCLVSVSVGRIPLVLLALLGDEFVPVVATNMCVPIAIT